MSARGEYNNVFPHNDAKENIKIATSWLKLLLLMDKFILQRGNVVNYSEKKCRIELY